MVTNGLMKNSNMLSMPILKVPALVFVAMSFHMGCSRANTPGVYRESKGTVVRFTVKQSDPVFAVTWFTKLQDGSMIRPKIYYYKTQRNFFGPQRVEESARTLQTISAKHKKFIYLPYSEEIATYLLLVRTSVLKEGRKANVKFDKADYEMADWQLLEIPAKDVSPENPIVFPPFEELSNRKLTKVQQQLLKDLVQRYNVIKAAGIKRMNTPVGATPMDCEAPRKPGTYLQGCGEVITVSPRLSDPSIRVARFVRLQDGSVLRPTLKYFRAQKHKNSEENENAFLTLIPEKKEWLDLPRSKEIAEYLFLVRRSFHKDAVPEYVKKTEQDPSSKEPGTQTDHVWANWQLLEISAEDSRSLVIPSYEKLAKHELTKDKKELLKDLVQRYDKAAAAARKRAATPVEPR